MFEKFTQEAKRILGLSRIRVLKWGHGCIGTPHILYEILENSKGLVEALFDLLGLDVSSVKERIEDKIIRGPNTFGAFSAAASLPFTARAKEVFEYANELSLKRKDSTVGVEHLLCALACFSKDGTLSTSCLVLREFGLSPERIEGALDQILGRDL